LDGADAEPDSGGDFGVVVVAQDERLVRLEAVIMENVLEDIEELKGGASRGWLW
jgi:hypothetical protein